MLKINTDIRHPDGDSLTLRSFIDPINETYIVNNVIFNYNTFETSLKTQIEYAGLLSGDTIMNPDNSKGRDYVYDYYKQIQLFGPIRANQPNYGTRLMFAHINSIGIPIESCKSYYYDSDLNQLFFMNTCYAAATNYFTNINYDDKRSFVISETAPHSQYPYTYVYKQGLLFTDNDASAIEYYYYNSSTDLNHDVLVDEDNNDEITIINIPDDQSYITFIEQGVDFIKLRQYTESDGETRSIKNFHDEILGDDLAVIDCDKVSASNFKNYYIDETSLKTLCSYFIKIYDEELGAYFWKINTYSIEVTDYDNSNIDCNVTNLNLNWGDFKHYLSFPDINFSRSDIDFRFTPYFKTLDDTKYLFIFLSFRTESTDFQNASGLHHSNAIVYSFKYDDENDVYNYISHNIFFARYYDEINYDELFGLDDVMVLTEVYDNNIYFSPIIFNGFDWEINRTIRSKLNVLRVRDHLIYVDHNNYAIVEKYITRPKLNVTFEKQNYTYVSDDIKTKVFVRSSYHLSNIASRIRVTVMSDNGKFETCDCKSFEVELYSGEYPLDFIITNIGEVRIDATLIGMYDLKDGLVREFSRTLSIKLDHKLERVWE